ncbi:hypothetical protein [Flavobacterium flavipallidum]|uniref:Alpha-L-arabinofuranosidase n=1 Tax=Flavobacterium flavipallidum TaxID=3139140 RepID=A0ABU9HJP7_9FLAO
MISKNLFYGVIILIMNISCSIKPVVPFSIEKKDFSFKEKVDIPNVQGIKISPILVGNNLWYNKITDQVWDLTAQSGVTSIRIGGHAYDNTLPSKSELLNWVRHIQAIGAEPIMQVSQYASPEVAAELVRYFNVELASGKAIKYWNIGNEPWLQNKKPDLSTVGAMVMNYFKPRAAAMKSIDSTIKIFGPDFCYYIEEAVDDLFGGKNDISDKVPGQSYYYCDGISWHRYPQDTSINLAYEGIEDFKNAIIKCKSRVDFVNKLHSRTGDNVLGWGIGEFNGKGGPQVHTWENGQMFGGVLDLCMKYGATYATTWSMFENDGNRKGTDFSSIDGENMIPRPSYRHMQMIAQNFKGIYVDGKSSLSDIITFGSVDGTTINVMIMNRANVPISFKLHLNKTDITKGKVNLNIDANSAKVYDGTIEPLATHTYVFKNNEIVRQVYTNQHFVKGQSPDKFKL